MSEIDEVEDKIEELRQAVRRSRQFMLAGRAAGIAGLVLFLALAFGILWPKPFLLVGSIALGLGGVVVSGSSRASTEELEASLARLEAARLALIDGFELVDVPERKLH